MRDEHGVAVGDLLEEFDGTLGRAVHPLIANSFRLPCGDLVDRGR
jgi:hypothetical protein